MGFLDALKGIGSAVLPMLGPLGGVASTLIDSATQRHANAANIQQAQQQEQFQHEETSTAWQRGVADIKAAGLNPALAYQQGGASSGGGAAATVAPTTTNTPSKFATALDTYNSLATGVAQRDLIREQTNAASADAALKQTQAAIQQPDVAVGRDADYIQAYLASKRAGAKGATFSAESIPKQITASLKNLNANTATAEAQASNLRSSTILNEQQMQNEWFRKNVSPYLQSTAATIKPFLPVFNFR